MEKALEIVLLIAVVAMIACILIYWRIDKMRYRTLAFVRYLDPDLTEWIETAAPLFELEPALERKEQYTQLSASFRGTKKSKAEEKVALANSLHDLVFNAALACGEDRQAREICASLKSLAQGFTAMIAQYNNGVEEFSRELNGGIGSPMGRLLRIKGLERLANFSELPGE